MVNNIIKDNWEIIEEKIIKPIYEDGYFPLTLADEVTKVLTQSSTRMNKQSAIEKLKTFDSMFEESPTGAIKEAIDALEKQEPKKVYHFLDDDTFETTCCGIDVTNKDYNYCPNCGCKLGEVEEVEAKDE
jgi:hypothetical protein